MAAAAHSESSAAMSVGLVLPEPMPRRIRFARWRVSAVFWLMTTYGRFATYLYGGERGMGQHNCAISRIIARRIARRRYVGRGGGMWGMRGVICGVM